MSREIKVRAWSIKKRKYIDIDTLYCANGKVCGIVYDGIVYDTDDVVLEQYTGSEDKNGKEVCEGDIVEEDIDFNSKMTDGTFRYKVYWNEDELCWSLDPIGPESIHNDLWELNSSCRVIGNVHEDKELLDGSN